MNGNYIVLGVFIAVVLLAAYAIYAAPVAPMADASKLAPPGYFVRRGFAYVMGQQVCDYKGRTGQIVGRCLVETDGREDVVTYKIRLDQGGYTVVDEQKITTWSPITRCGNE